MRVLESRLYFATINMDEAISSTVTPRIGPKTSLMEWRLAPSPLCSEPRAQSARVALCGVGR
jgi:hypothetical protein